MDTTTQQDGRAPSAAPVRIPLHNRAGEVIAEALISPDDAPRLTRHRWHQNAHGYAIRLLTLPEKTPKGKSRQRAVFLHREVLGLEFGDPRQGDHINRVRLDNTRENLRIVTVAQQRANVTAGRGVSKYRGVAWRKDLGKWCAQGSVNGSQRHIGMFDSEDEAGAAAREWRLKYMPGAID